MIDAMMMNGNEGNRRRRRRRRGWQTKVRERKRGWDIVLGNHQQQRALRVQQEHIERVHREFSFLVGDDDDDGWWRQSHRKERERERDTSVGGQQGEALHVPCALTCMPSHYITIHNTIQQEETRLIREFEPCFSIEFVVCMFFCLLPITYLHTHTHTLKLSLSLNLYNDQCHPTVLVPIWMNGQEHDRFQIHSNEFDRHLFMICVCGKVNHDSCYVYVMCVLLCIYSSNSIPLQFRWMGKKILLSNMNEQIHSWAVRWDVKPKHYLLYISKIQTHTRTLTYNPLTSEWNQISIYPPIVATSHNQWTSDPLSSPSASACSYCTSSHHST